MLKFEIQFCYPYFYFVKWINKTTKHLEYIIDCTNEKGVFKNVNQF